MGKTIIHRWNWWWRRSYGKAGKGASKTQCSVWGLKPHIKKIAIFAPYSNKYWRAVHKIRFLHSIKELCRVLRVNRSTYYKHFNAELAPRIKKNHNIVSMILHIYADYNKRFGAYKITCVLKRDYGMDISVLFLIDQFFVYLYLIALDFAAAHKWCR